jgi:hypothetical protein
LYPVPVHKLLIALWIVLENFVFVFAVTKACYVKLQFSNIDTDNTKIQGCYPKNGLFTMCYNHEKPVMLNLIHTGSKPQYTVRTLMTRYGQRGVLSMQQAFCLRMCATSPLPSR